MNFMYKDRKFVKAMVEKDGLHLVYASPELQRDTEIILAAISQNPNAIDLIDKSFLSDKQFVLKAIPITTLAFGLASDALQEDLEIAMVFIKCGGDLLMVHPKLRENVSLVKLAVRRKEQALTIFLSKDMRANKEVIMEAVKYNASSIELASFELLNDRDYVLRLLSVNGLLLQYLPFELRQSVDIISAAVHQNPMSFEFVPQILRQDYNFMFEMVGREGLLLKYTPLEFQSDFELVRRAVSNNGLALQFASYEMQALREMVMLAVQSNPMSIQFSPLVQHDLEFLGKLVLSNEKVLGYIKEDVASDLMYYLRSKKTIQTLPFFELLKTNHEYMQSLVEVELNNKDYIMECVKTNGLSLKFAPRSLRDSFEVVQQACTQNGMALQFASFNLQQNIDIVLCAVKQNGLAINYASIEFRENREVVLHVVKTFPAFVNSASVELRNDREIIAISVRSTLNNIVTDHYPLKYASDILKDDYEIVLESVKKYGISLEFASDRLKQDKSIVMEAVKKNGLSLKYASKDLRSDREVILEAVKQFVYSVQYALMDVGNDKEIMLILVGFRGKGFSLYPMCSIHLMFDKDIVLRSLRTNDIFFKLPSLLQHDHDILLEAIKHDNLLFPKLPESIRENRDFVLTILQVHGHLFLKIPQKFKNEREMVLAAVSSFGWALGSVNIEFRNDLEIVMKAVQNQGSAVYYMGHDFSVQDTEMIHLGAVKNNANSIKYIKNPSREVCLTALKSNGMALMYVTKPDDQMILEAVKSNPKSISYVYFNETPQFFLKKVIEANEKVLDDVSSTIAYLDTMIILRELANIYSTDAKQYSQIVIDLKSYIHISSYRHYKKLPELLKQYSSNTIDRSQLIVFYDLISEVVSREQNNSKDLLVLCNLVKTRMWWATNINSIIRIYTETYVKNEKEILLMLHFKNFKPKSQNLFTKKMYSSSRVIEFVLLQIFSNIIAENKLYEVNLQDANERGANYYLLNDMMNLFIHVLTSKVEETNFVNFEHTVKLLALHMDRMIVNGQSNPMTTNTFIADWVKMPSFPSLKSMTDLIAHNMKVDSFQNIRLYAKLIYERFPYYYCVSVLGNGGQGTVFKCFNTNFNRFDAIKISDGIVSGDFDRWTRMFDFMRKDTKGIIKCYNCGIHRYKDLSYLYFVMELGKESLQDYIHRLHENESTSKLSKSSLVQIIGIFMDVLQAVINLHNEQFTHRDLKLSNIVMCENGPKLIDFDSSRIIQQNKSVTLNIGTFEYLAPELHDENEGYLSQNVFISQKSDIFSLGCILLKMITNLTLKISESASRNGNHFFGNGFYFHVILSLASGQSKLHHAILSELENFIDPSFNITKIIGRCLITMIQSRSAFRGECIMYLKIMEIVRNALISDTDPEIPDSLIEGLLDIDLELISGIHKENQLLLSQNNLLTRKNQELLDTVLKLTQDLTHSKEAFHQLEERNEELQLQITYLKEVLSDSFK